MNSNEARIVPHHQPHQLYVRSPITEPGTQMWLLWVMRKHINTHGCLFCASVFPYAGRLQCIHFPTTTHVAYSTPVTDFIPIPVHGDGRRCGSPRVHVNAPSLGPCVSQMGGYCFLATRRLGHPWLDEAGPQLVAERCGLSCSAVQVIRGRGRWSLEENRSREEKRESPHPMRGRREPHATHTTVWTCMSLRFLLENYLDSSLKFGKSL